MFPWERKEKSMGGGGIVNLDRKMSLSLRGNRGNSEQCQCRSNANATLNGVSGEPGKGQMRKGRKSLRSV